MSDDGARARAAPLPTVAAPKNWLAARYFFEQHKYYFLKYYYS